VPCTVPLPGVISCATAARLEHNKTKVAAKRNLNENIGASMTPAPGTGNQFKVKTS
jgi:hypothetical protein